MKEIRSYFKVNETIASSGQPTKEQFSTIANYGYSAVVNLAMPTSDFAIANEDEIVCALGMLYVPIPVVWEAPQLTDLEHFFVAMQNFKDKKVWVHCALNMRASCFIYLYKKHVLKAPDEQALHPMREIWQPSGVWGDFVNLAKNTYSSYHFP
jgi:protein tyrosine phosphatase (PTP) superfamily phosphohydrolase (DUF442 family)